MLNNDSPNWREVHTGKIGGYRSRSGVVAPSIGQFTVFSHFDVFSIPVRFSGSSLQQKNVAHCAFLMKSTFLFHQLKPPRTSVHGNKLSQRAKMFLGKNDGSESMLAYCMNRCNESFKMLTSFGNKYFSSSFWPFCQFAVHKFEVCAPTVTKN